MLDPLAPVDVGAAGATPALVPTLPTSDPTIAPISPERVGIPSAFGPAPEGMIARPVDPAIYAEAVAPHFVTGPNGEQVPVPEAVRLDQIAKYQAAARAVAAPAEQPGFESRFYDKAGNLVPLAPLSVPGVPTPGASYEAAYRSALPIAQRAELSADIQAQPLAMRLGLGAGAEAANVLSGFGLLPAAAQATAGAVGATSLEEALADYAAFQGAVQDQPGLSAVGAGRLIGGALPFMLSGGASAAGGTAGAIGRAATFSPRAVSAIGNAVERAVGIPLGEAVQARVGATLASEVAKGNISEAAADTASKLVGAGVRAGLRMGSEMFGIGVAQETAAEVIDDNPISIGTIVGAGALSAIMGVTLGATAGGAAAAARLGVSEARGRAGNFLAAQYRKHMPILGGVEGVEVPKAIKTIKPDLKGMSGEEIVENFNPANWRDAEVQQNRYDVMHQVDLRKQVAEETYTALDDMFKADKESRGAAASRGSMVAERIPENLRGRVAVQANHVLDAIDEIVGNRMLRGQMGKQLEGEVNLAAREISTAGEASKFDHSFARDIADYAAETRKNLGEYLERFRAKAEAAAEQRMWDKMPEAERTKLKASVGEYSQLQDSLDGYVMAGDYAGHARAQARMSELAGDVEAVARARAAAFREPDVKMQPSPEVTAEIARRLMVIKSMVGNAVDKYKSVPELRRSPEQVNSLRALAPVYGLLKETVESPDVFGQEAVDMLSESGSKYAAKMAAKRRLFDRLGIKRVDESGRPNYEIAMGKLNRAIKNMSDVENAPVFAALKDYLDAEVSNQEVLVRMFGADNAALQKSLEASERAKSALDRGADVMYKVHQAEMLRKVDKESKLLKPGSRLSLPSLLALAGFKTAGPYGAVAGGVSGQALASGAQVVASPYKSMQVVGAFRERSNRIRDMFAKDISGFLQGKPMPPSAGRRATESLLTQARVTERGREREASEVNEMLRGVIDVTSSPQKIQEASLAASTDVSNLSPEAGQKVQERVQQLLEKLRSTVPPRLIEKNEDLPEFVDRRLLWSPERRKGFVMSREEQVNFVTNMKAAFDPMGTISSWTKTGATRTSVDAIQRFHPDLYQEVRRLVLMTASGLAKDMSPRAKRMSYKRRLQLGTMFDIPTDLSLSAPMLSALQSTYEVSAEGGTGEGSGGGGSQLRRKLNTSVDVETEAQATERGAQ